MYDVIIAGGGPAGSYTAWQLAKNGLSVLVLEKNQQVGQKLSCTGIIGRECYTRFAVPDSVVHHVVNSATLYAPSGEQLRVYRPEPQACIVDRPAFDGWLAEQATQAGVEYRLTSRVTGISMSGTEAVVYSVCGDVIARDRCRIVVLANGSNSSLAGKLGLGRCGDMVAGIQAQVELCDSSGVEVYTGREVAPGFFAWLVPSSNGYGRVGLMTRRNPRVYLDTLLRRLCEEGKIAGTDVPVHVAPIPLKPLPRTYGDRLLVIGDAAGQVKPTSGGGIYYGLLCAQLAAQTVCRTLATGDMSRVAMSQYQRDWHQLLKREMQIGRATRFLYEQLGDRVFNRLFNTLARNNIPQLLGEDKSLSFDWHGRVVLRMIQLLAQRKVSRFLHPVRG